jgi:hypothetical protein
VALNGRDVRFVFDSDLMLKSAVRQALARLTEHLQRKRAHVAAVYLPQQDGRKVGVDDYLRSHGPRDLEGLIETPRPQPQAAKPLVELLEAPSKSITRPLSLIDGRAYAVSWPWVRITETEVVDQKTQAVVQLKEPRIREAQVPLIVRDDGVLFSSLEDPRMRPLHDLGLSVRLHDPPPDNRLWSTRGVVVYQRGGRPDAAEVFRRLVKVIDRFMDFKKSLAASPLQNHQDDPVEEPKDGGQQMMCELVACYTLASYGLEAFPVIGYLWPNGDRGSGKTNLLLIIGEVAYLGQVILAGGSYASLRDLADYGATLGFDDAEDLMDVKRGDPDKRALLLAGNRRGSQVTIKELVDKGVWRTRFINTFCPRLFSAIKLPDAVLASRTIMIPLVRSADERRAKADPLDHETWPHDRRQLLDDLWALALAHLPTLKRYDAEAAKRATLIGRDFEPWRAILAVALWLTDAHGVEGLFDRMHRLSIAYQTERCELEAHDLTRLLILALQELATRSQNSLLEFETSTVTTVINRLALAAEIATEEKSFTNPIRVGLLLKRLRFQKAPRTADRKRWQVSKDEVASLARSYGMGDPPQPGTPGTPGNPAASRVPGCQECQDCRDEEEVPSHADGAIFPNLEEVVI